MSLRRLVAAAVFAVAALAVLAGPAGAHALLLHSTPAGNATLPSSPPAVQLRFSEPVEVQFGAVKVLDADGKVAAGGPTRRADGGREVDLPLRHLADGTYTVTWQVVSSDGHASHGSFRFYVGAPSAISAVAIEAPSGPGVAVRWGFGAVRFLWFASLMLLVGAVAIRVLVWTPSVRAAGADGEAFRRRFARALPVAAGGLLVTTLVSLVLEAASISGLSVAASAKPSVLRDVLRTGYGQGWLVELASIAVLVLVVVALVGRPGLLGVGRRQWLWVGGAAAAGAATGAALSGHARTDPHPWLSVALVAVHLLAASVWVGGLACLVLLAAPGWRGIDGGWRLLRQVVTRFTRVAMIAVLVLVVAGTIVAIGDVGSIRALLTSSYGRVLSGKVALMCLALALAVRHWRVTPVRLRTTEAPAEVTTFGRTACVEAALLVATVALAASLVALTPGRSLQSAATGLLDVQRHAGPYDIELTIDPRAVGSNEVHITFLAAGGALATDVAAVQARLQPPTGAAVPVDARVFTPGHFVATVELPTTGRYRLTVSGNGASTTFPFTVAQGRATGS